MGPGQSLNQRPLLQSTPMDPSLNRSRSITAIANQVWNDFSSRPSHSAWNPPAPSPSALPSPPHPQYTQDTTPVNGGTSHTYLDSVPPPVSRRPGDLRTVGRLCSNCIGLGWTLGHFMGLGNKTCNGCRGSGRRY
jgi:hypothetical protein